MCRGVCLPFERFATKGVTIVIVLINYQRLSPF
jgi:hypothetical protein